MKYSRLRGIVEDSIAKMIRRDLISEDEYIKLISVYYLFEEGKEYTVGELVRHDDKLYEIIQAHTSQIEWLPDISPALFKEVVPTGVIPIWVQPIGTQDAYSVGDKVTFNDEIYESTVDNNVWSPADYGWVIVE